MLNTNEINSIAQSIGQAVGSFVHEIVTATLVVAIPLLIRIWRQSRIKTAIINALVRGVERSGNNISRDDTAFVKKAIHKEAVNTGVQEHVDKAVKEVTNKMAEEKTDAANLKAENEKNQPPP